MTFRDYLVKAVPYVAGVVLITSLFFWLWTLRSEYRRTGPAAGIIVPYVIFEVAVAKDGVHFFALSLPSVSWPGISLGGPSWIVNAGYHHGFVINVLGLVVAVLPQTFNGGDYLVLPHFAIVIPYWLWIIASGYLLIAFTPIAGWLAPYSSPSRISGSVAGLVLFVFLTLNLVPNAWRPGAAIQPDGLLEWANLIFMPDTVAPEISCGYGFPFRCLDRGFIQGRSVDLFYGAEMDWKQHRAMENLGIALASSFAVLLVVNWLRRDIDGCKETEPSSAEEKPAKPDDE